MSGLVQKVQDKLSNHNERDTSDSYGSSNQAGGQAAGGGGKYGGPVGHSSFDNEQTDSRFGRKLQNDQALGRGGQDRDIRTSHEATTLSRSGRDAYRSGNQSRGQVGHGDGRYPRTVETSIGGNDSSFKRQSAGLEDADSYGSAEAGGLAAQGGGEYPGRVGVSKPGWE